MAKISRFLLKLFGDNGPVDDFAEFGSQTAGSPVKSKDPAVIQALDAWLNGWKDAIVSANKAPFLEDMNALFYVQARALAYLYQDGIPAWNIDTNYFVGSIAKRDGTMELYMSLINDNLGNALPNQVGDSNWKYINNSIGNPPGTIIQFAGTDVPEGYLFCGGGNVSRATYANLFSAIGINWGAGDGSTTFGIPDLKGKFTACRDGNGPLFNPLAATGGSTSHAHTQVAHAHVQFLHIHDHVHTHSTPSHQHPLDFAVILHQFTTNSAKVYSVEGDGNDLTTSTPSTSSGSTLRRIRNQTTVSGAETTGGPSVNTTGTQSDTGMNSQTPVINSTTTVPPFVVLNFLIKT